MRKMILLFLLIIALLPSVSKAEELPNIQLHDYVQVGRYNGTPLKWQKILEDEHGSLFFIDHMLCSRKYFSRYGQYIWKESYLRSWLNSETDFNNTQWYNTNDILFRGYTRYYSNENGFLHNNNFSYEEKQLFKSVELWTMTNHRRSENGITSINDSYHIVKDQGTGVTNAFMDGYVPPTYYTFDDIPQIYYGPAEKTTDKIFLLDEMQLYNAVQSGLPVPDYMMGFRSTESDQRMSVLCQQELLGYTSEFDMPIYPAFYLDETAIVTCTGTGTLEDPYVLNAPTLTNLSVELNGNELDFDQPPIIQNDRVMVPFRAIFEALGADVEWIADTQTVIGTKDDTTITLTIGSNILNINDLESTLDSPPIIVNDRTLVPVRAISEALRCEISWDEATQTVLISSN